MNKEFGGTAEAARKAAGGMATLSMWFGEFKETVGGKVNQVLDTLSQWLGRVLDKAQPLVDMVTAIVDEFAGLYREIGDVLEGLGLFNDKTDTAAVVIEVLKGALTLMLIPIRALVQAAKGVVDVFIDWYNKSELLRGILGGLGAVVVSVFTTIKDDAIKILGGVGDIIVGIFTLDKDKIVAGFKSALSATADVALASGQRAAEQFLKGYEANKNNHITRTVRVNTEETGGEEKLPAGAGKLDKVEESAADKKAREAKEKKAQADRDKAGQARLNALKEFVKQEDALEDARIAAIADKREREIADINRDARRKYSQLTGLEHNYTEQVAAIYQERDNRLKEVADKGQEEANKTKEKALQEAIGLIEAGEIEKESLLALKYAQGKSSEQQYQDDLYQLKVDALKRELALLEAAGKGETEQAKKIRAALNIVDKDHEKEKTTLKNKE